MSERANSESRDLTLVEPPSSGDRIEKLVDVLVDPPDELCGDPDFERWYGDVMRQLSRTCRHRDVQELLDGE